MCGELPVAVGSSTLACARRERSRGMATLLQMCSYEPVSLTLLKLRVFLEHFVCYWHFTPSNFKTLWFGFFSVCSLLIFFLTYDWKGWFLTHFFLERIFLNLVFIHLHSIFTYPDSTENAKSTYLQNVCFSTLAVWDRDAESVVVV